METDSLFDDILNNTNKEESPINIPKILERKERQSER